MVQDIAPFPESSTWMIREARKSNDEQKRKRNISIWRERRLIYLCRSHNDSRSIAFERGTRRFTVEIIACRELFTIQCLLSMG
jgi:hypothetical protein